MKRNIIISFIMICMMSSAALAANTVAIDPGHQGEWVNMSEKEPSAPGSSEMKAKCTTGTTGRFTGVPEYKLNLDVSLKLRDELVRRGYNVVMTREDNDAAISNSERALMAAEKGGDVYVRIHANGSDDSSVNGALAMVMSPNNPYVGNLYEKSNELAGDILNAYCEKTGFRNLGIQNHDDMTGINWSKIPVMILEMGFMTNESDDRAMQEEAVQEKMVNGIADGLDVYFKKYGSPDTADPAGEAAGTTETAEAVEAAQTPEIGNLVYEQFILSRQMMGEKWAVGFISPDLSDYGKEDTSDSKKEDKAEAVTEHASEAETDQKKDQENAGAGAVGDTNCWMINGDEVLQSASVIKLFIMGCVYDRICYPSSPEKTIQYTEPSEGKLRQTLESMITVSSNEAANALIDILGEGDSQAGMKAVNDFCVEHGYKGVHLGRKFLESNPKDDNYISAQACMKFLCDVYRGTLVNQEASEKMLTILKGQTLKNKIPSGLPAGFTSANKTGEMPLGYNLGCIENDVAIIWPDQGTPYILVVLSNELGGRNNEAIQITRQISAFVAEKQKK